jgi:hypothetical protein
MSDDATRSTTTGRRISISALLQVGLVLNSTVLVAALDPKNPPFKGD